MRYRLDLEYEGTRYHGWQVQPRQRTVQGELQRAVGLVCGQAPLELQGAGRTDAGVHALAQVAHLEVESRLSPPGLRHQLNDHLPPDIAVLRVEPCRADFHARHNALSRSYLYQISRRRSAFGKKLVWWIKDRLDLQAMQQAAVLFPGLRDLRSFCADKTARETRVEIQELTLAEAGELILVRIRASHFLWKMVRQMVGVLAEVARGKLTPAEVQGFLKSPSERPAALTAPPSGLFLERVVYPGEPPLAELPRPVLWIG